MKFAFTLFLLSAILLYFYMIAPNLPRRTKTSLFSKKCFAHRGLFDNTAEYPENSLPAFEHAVHSGYGIELDVQLTKDNQVVVFHDNTLSRMCGIDLMVRDKTYEQLCEMNLLKTTERIPLFQEVLNIVDGRVPLIVEIKLPVTSLKTCELVNEILTVYKGPYCIESFNTLALRWYKKHRPDIVRGQLSSNLTRPVADGGLILSAFIKYLLANFLGKPDFIAYCYEDAANISFLLNKYLFRTMTIAWTVRSKAVYKSCKKKFDSIIFEGFFA